MCALRKQPGWETQHLPQPALFACHLLLGVGQGQGEASTATCFLSDVQPWILAGTLSHCCLTAVSLLSVSATVALAQGFGSGQRKPFCFPVTSVQEPRYCPAARWQRRQSFFFFGLERLSRHYLPPVAASGEKDESGVRTTSCTMTVRR